MKTRVGGEGEILELGESIGGMLKILPRKERIGGKFFKYSEREVPCDLDINLGKNKRIDLNFDM